MKCKEIKNNLYDFISNRLEEATSKEVEEHLEQCNECKPELEKLKKTLSILDHWDSPKLNEYFTNKVMSQIIDIRRKRVTIFKKLFRPSLIPLEAVALVCIVFLGVLIFRGIFTPKVKEVSRELKIQLEITEAKNPIIIETENIELTFISMNEIIRTHNGDLISSKKVESGIKIIFYVKEEKERELFQDLKQLGRTKIKKKGYKNRNGNIVMIIKEIPNN